MLQYFTLALYVPCVHDCHPIVYTRRAIIKAVKRQKLNTAIFILLVQIITKQAFYIWKQHEIEVSYFKWLSLCCFAPMFKHQIPYRILIVVLLFLHNLDKIYCNFCILSNRDFTIEIIYFG